MKKYTGDRLVAMHEVGHFIFYVRTLVEEFGKEGAKKIITEQRPFIKLESKDWATFKGTERVARFAIKNTVGCDGIKSTFLIDVGGLAVELLLNKSLRGYVKRIAESNEDNLLSSNLVPSNDVTKAMLSLGSEYKSSSDLLNKIDELTKTITRDEWKAIHIISLVLYKKLESSHVATIKCENYAPLLFG